jgi:hypothetical protein
MIFTDFQLLEEALGRWHSFDECLLNEMRFVRFGFGIDLVFNYIWQTKDRVRNNILDNPHLVTFGLLGVESLQFHGGLTSGLRANFDRINWGLSEVATVRAFHTHDNLGLSVLWESSRQLRVEFLKFEVREDC